MSRDPIVLWVGGYGPRDSSHGLGLATFREVVESRSEGRVSVRVTWNIMDEGRPMADLLRLVDLGEMFLCYFSSSYVAARVPELNAIEIPFLFGDLAEAHRALDGDLGVVLTEAVRRRTSFELLGFWDNGFRHLTNGLKPVRRPSDCRDMTIRVQPNEIHESLVRSWGAEPVAVDLDEGIRLISSGRVDAQENPLANTVAYGVDDVHDHYTMTGHLYGARGLWANRSALHALPPELVDVVREGASDAIAAQRREASEVEVRLRRRLERAGARFVDLDQQERSEFLVASQPAIERARSQIPSHLQGLL